MDRGPKPTPSQRRWRVVLALLGVVVLVWGVASIAVGGADAVSGAGLRILVSAVVLPALLLPVQAIALGRRPERLRTSLGRDLAEVEAVVAAETYAVGPLRGSGLTEQDLHRTAAALREAQEAAQRAPVEQVVSAVAVVAEVTAHWPVGERRLVVRCVRTADRLVRLAGRSNRPESTTAAPTDLTEPTEPTDRLARLKAALAVERSTAVDGRDTGLDDVSLTAVEARVTRARVALEAHGPAAAEPILADLARQVGDSWPYGSRIGAQVLACHRALLGR